MIKISTLTLVIRIPIMYFLAEMFRYIASRNLIDCYFDTLKKNRQEKDIYIKKCLTFIHHIHLIAESWYLIEEETLRQKKTRYLHLYTVLLLLSIGVD